MAKMEFFIFHQRDYNNAWMKVGDEGRRLYIKLLMWPKKNLRLFLNQACAGHRPARAWFLEITLMRTSVCAFVCVCVCVCVCPRGHE